MSTELCVLLILLHATSAIPIGKKKHIFFSWSAAFRIATNGSQKFLEEKQNKIFATGTAINGTLNIDDFFPDSFIIKSPIEENETAKSTKFPNLNNNISLFRSRRNSAKEYEVEELEEAMHEAKAKHDKKNEDNEEHESEDEFELSPETKVKIYSGIILGTVFLVIFVMCVWPLFKCCRTCCQVGTAGCLAFWDLLHCRDPGYRLMCLAAKQAGLDPPSPEEYDAFMSGWEEKAPELMAALMD